MRPPGKYFLRLEVLFFVGYFIVFNIITDVEYNLYENHNASLFVRAMPERLIYGIVYIIPFWICYRLIIWKYLLKKRYIRFLISLVLFLVALNFYLLLSYWVITLLRFLPQQITSNADRFFRADVPVHFSIIYMFRELLVIACLGYFIRSFQQEREMNLLREQQLKAELNYLRVQLEPHFFFNTLNNIYAHTLQQSEHAALLVARYAEVMRYILYESSSRKVALEKEIAFLANYTEVEKARFGNQVCISFDTQGIQPDAQIEPLLLLTFVENAFKHGLREQTGVGYVKIVVCQAGGELTLQVVNSKTPAIPKVTAGNGIGLENVVKRLNMLYPGKYSLNITDDETEYMVCVTIQLS